MTTYGPIWVDLVGTEVLDVEIPILQHKNTGGVLLFTRNYTSVVQLKSLVHSIRAIAGKPILIAVDHEGGKIWRFREGFIKPAAPQTFGDLYKNEPELALTRLEIAGEIVAHELLTCGVDLSFAPVLDVDVGISIVLGDRSYSQDPLIVTNCARAFINGLNKQGMGAVGKHFPGHGGCVMDSHFTAAVDTRSLTEIENVDLIPFTHLQQHLAGIMPAHVVYPNIDLNPAGFSQFWLQEILRQKLKFKGAIISDCLSMLGSGVADKITNGVELALAAGCDMVITAQQTRENLLYILDSITWQTQEEQVARITALAGDFANPRLCARPVVAPEIITG